MYGDFYAEQKAQKCDDDRHEARIAELEARLATAEAEVVRLRDAAEDLRFHLGCESVAKDGYLTECEAASAVIADLEARCAEMKAALNDAIESIEDWAGYASEYFRQKHGLAEEVARLKALAEGGKHG